jgi:hypothetical protein
MRLRRLRLAPEPTRPVLRLEPQTNDPESHHPSEPDVVKDLTPSLAARPPESPSDCSRGFPVQPAPARAGRGVDLATGEREGAFQAFEVELE